MPGVPGDALRKELEVDCVLFDGGNVRGSMFVALGWGTAKAGRDCFSRFFNVILPILPGRSQAV